ncbi:MAG TPA: RagB/SusD family nutrient uptake outer membrane protein [Chitinophaga sp.]|uniref:RagB/SusD family nutrient uptake outer membrane protein n=1 Tax=Chitinophaga sp. TaxID=1869181 RepID=UPI002C45E76F|nr:RagB/SusD family nutrient uptake outer membrane protein [Chitinophaga sp.]HVI48745.1 RagB/SusD family nutrient uptake outer membrane protein [Chitinophaga sp.]
MKRQIKLYTAVAGFTAMGLLGSCGKDFLDLKPYVSVPTDEAFKSVSDVENAMTGVYASLTETDFYGRSIPVIGDLMGDNTTVSVKNSGRYIPQFKYSVTVTDATNSVNWLDAYKTILRANNVIDGVDKKFANDDLGKQYKAEALTVRALVYFNLVRTFGKPYTDAPASDGVPIVLHYDRDAKPARNKVQEVYQQIVKDLDAAYPLFTQEGSPVTRMSKYASRALAAKVALYMGDYAKALTYSEDVISNSGVVLLKKDRVASYWAEASPSATTPETLFEVGADAVNNNGNDELGNMYNQLGYGDLLCTTPLYDLYSTTDVRKALIIDGKRGGQRALIVNKYQHISEDYDNKKVLRMSEMVLIAAEAANRTGDDTKAQGYLNTLMAERDPNQKYTSTGTQLLDDIITERRKELAFEGDRFHDLNRLKRNLVNGGGTAVNYGDYRRVSPIPQTERDANPNMTQNDGYTK